MVGIKRNGILSPKLREYIKHKNALPGIYKRRLVSEANNLPCYIEDITLIMDYLSDGHFFKGERINPDVSYELKKKMANLMVGAMYPDEASDYESEFHNTMQKYRDARHAVGKAMRQFQTRTETALHLLRKIESENVTWGLANRFCSAIMSDTNWKLKSKRRKWLKEKLEEARHTYRVETNVKYSNVISALSVDVGLMSNEIHARTQKLKGFNQWQTTRTLNLLVEWGFVKKEREKYMLTLEGKELKSNISEK
ncbi:Uncharacterised protein [uncultured archaeon]|nr:Uncharacterised protein [uncultured archaeon]